MYTQKAQNKIPADLAILLKKLEPMMNELMAAPTKEIRRKLQREIITLTQEAGYHDEVLKLKAMFNV